jgi:hypothetical protein
VISTGAIDTAEFFCQGNGNLVAEPMGVTAAQQQQQQQPWDASQGKDPSGKSWLVLQETPLGGKQ